MTILIIILVVLALFVLITYNSLVSKKHKVAQARSSIDVYLNQRFDLIPNLVETVKGYAKHEKEIFEETIRLRTSYFNSKDLDEASLLNSKCNSILAIAENYPELKANENFLSLQKSLSKMENQLQAARRLYNIEVTDYNTKLNVVPTNIIAKIFNFKIAKMFEADTNEKENVKVEI